MLMVKSKIDKPLSLTKAAYKEAVEQLLPAEKLNLAYECGRFEETEDKLSLSSTSDFDSSLDIVDEDNVVVAVEAENEAFNNAET